MGGFPLPHNIMQNAEVNGFLRKRSLPASIAAVFSQIVHAESIQKELRPQKPNPKGRAKKRKLTRSKYAECLYAAEEAIEEGKAEEAIEEDKAEEAEWMSIFITIKSYFFKKK